MGSIINYDFGDYYLTIMAFGMNLTELLIIAMALFLPLNNLALEYERGTAQVLWAKIETRSTYFLGKFFAFLILIFSLSIFSSLFIGILAFIQNASFSHILMLRYFIGGQLLQTACILSLVFFIYSIFHTPVLSSLLVLLLIYFSIFLETAREISVQSESFIIKAFYTIMYYGMPQLSYFNFENHIIYKQEVSFSYGFVAFTYAVIFTGVFLSFSNILFNKREF